jgi:hypothetical protein
MKLDNLLKSHLKFVSSWKSSCTVWLIAASQMASESISKECLLIFEDLVKIQDDFLDQFHWKVGSIIKSL